MAPLHVQKEVSQPSSQQVCPFWTLSLPTLGAHSAHWAASGLCLGCVWAASGLRLGCVWAASGLLLACVCAAFALRLGCF